MYLIIKKLRPTTCIIHYRPVHLLMFRLLRILRVTRQVSAMVPSTNHTRDRWLQLGTIKGQALHS